MADLEERPAGLVQVLKVALHAVRPIDHGAELEHREGLEVAPEALLLDQDRPGRLEADDKRDHEHRRPERQDQGPADRQVDEPLQAGFDTLGRGGL